MGRAFLGASRIKLGASVLLARRVGSANLETIWLTSLMHVDLFILILAELLDKKALL